jgi:hypothetical protein
MYADQFAALKEISDKSDIKAKTESKLKYIGEFDFCGIQGYSLIDYKIKTNY